jgi:hypothetical protein
MTAHCTDTTPTTINFDWIGDLLWRADIDFRIRAAVVELARYRDVEGFTWRQAVAALSHLSDTHGIRAHHVRDAWALISAAGRV